MLQTLEATAQGPAPSILELPPVAAPRTEVDDAALRRALREQVSRLEGRLGRLAGELGRAGRGRALVAPALASAGPRLLGLAELERARDELVGRVQAAEHELAACDAGEARARDRLEAMLADPAGHRWARVHREEIGEPGCGAYEVRPRAGLLGMLLNWWRVKLSSGCP
jgi:hypothetical protein